MGAHQNRVLTIVITGASRGIGAAIAKKYALAGHKVAICARKLQDLQHLSESTKSTFPILYKTCDVSSKDDLKAFHDFVASTLGTPDVLVLNAGVFMPGGIFTEAEGVLETQLQTNLIGAYHLCRLFLPNMTTKRSGHIFTMCSTASITAYVNGGSYCISKFALYGMTKVLREEMKAHQIKVTAILPGATITDSWAGSNLPPERFIQPEDVAQAVYETSILSPSAVIEEILIRPLAGDI